MATRGKKRLCARTLQFVACRLRDEGMRREATGAKANRERFWASVFADLAKKVKATKLAAKAAAATSEAA